MILYLILFPCDFSYLFPGYFQTNVTDSPLYQLFVPWVFSYKLHWLSFIFCSNNFWLLYQCFHCGSFISLVQSVWSEKLKYLNTIKIRVSCEANPVAYRSGIIIQDKLMKPVFPFLPLCVCLNINMIKSEQKAVISVWSAWIKWSVQQKVLPRFFWQTKLSVLGPQLKLFI